MTALAVVLALAMPQGMTVDPGVVRIPAGQQVLDKWPDYYTDPQVGYQTFKITYTVPAAGIKTGGSVAFGLGYMAEDLGNNPAYSINSGWMFGPTETMARFPIGQIQRNNAAAANYCTASSSTGFVTVSTLTHSNYGREVLLKVTANSFMAAGTVWTVKLGDTHWGGPGMTLSWEPGRVRVVAMEDFNGTGVLTPNNSDVPVILITGDHVDRFIVNGPVTPKVGVPTTLTIRPVMGSDNPSDGPIMPVENFRGKVHLSSSDPKWTSSSPPEIQFWPSDRGVKRIAVTFNTPGIQTITAQLYKDVMTLDDDIVGSSNSMWVQDANSDLVVYCGDMQRHSSEGGHAGVPDYKCWADLWDQRQDFGTVVQHSELYMSGFYQAVDSASRFQSDWDPRESQFACLPGYEWGYPGSHRHVVYKGWTTDVSVCSSNYTGFETPPPLVENTTVASFLSRLGTMTSNCPHLAIPHHSLWNRAGAWNWVYDWGPDLNSAMQPVVEIYSKHGSSEVWLQKQTDPDDYLMHMDITKQRSQGDLASVRDALKMGYRFGIVAGSDQHGYNTICNGIGDYTRSGLAFVRASRQDSIREGVWKGLAARHCYGTTGARIYLNWVESPTNTGMGDECTDPTPTFGVDAHASGIGIRDRPEFVRMDVVRDDQVVHSSYYAASDVADAYVDPAPIKDGKYHSYYVRMLQEDDHVAWSSPIWVLSP